MPNARCISTRASSSSARSWRRDDNFLSIHWHPTARPCEVRMSDFKLVWKNLMRRKLRTFLMLFAILIAFMIFGVLAALEQAFDSNAGSSGDRLVVVNKINFTQPLPISYVQRVRALEGVK